MRRPHKLPLLNRYLQMLFPYDTSEQNNWSLHMGKAKSLIACEHCKIKLTNPYPYFNIYNPDGVKLLSRVEPVLTNSLNKNLNSISSCINLLCF